MKKLTGILCGLSLIIASSSFTPPKDDTVSSKVRSAFERTFSSSSGAYWERINGFYIVTFKVNDTDFSAAYNDDGKLMSASRYVDLTQLPLNITLALDQKYSRYTIHKKVTELTVDGFTNYYIKAENAKHAITIKASGTGDLSIENKTKK